MLNGHRRAHPGLAGTCSLLSHEARHNTVQAVKQLVLGVDRNTLQQLLELVAFQITVGPSLATCKAPRLLSL